MNIKVNVQSSQDVIFEGTLLLSPASNYGDGIDRGFRPAISWALVRMPDNVLSSGMFNIKDQLAQETAEAAVTTARGILFADGDCMCGFVVDQMLEEYEREV